MATRTAREQAVAAFLRAIETSSGTQRAEQVVAAVDAMIDASRETEHGRAVQQMIDHGNLGRLHDGDAPAAAEELKEIADNPDPRD